MTNEGGQNYSRVVTSYDSSNATSVCGPFLCLWEVFFKVLKVVLKLKILILCSTLPNNSRNSNTWKPKSFKKTDGGEFKPLPQCKVARTIYCYFFTIHFFIFYFNTDSPSSGSQFVDARILKLFLLSLPKIVELNLVSEFVIVVLPCYLGLF